jgi:hypothetical protein
LLLRRGIKGEPECCVTHGGKVAPDRDIPTAILDVIQRHCSPGLRVRPARRATVLGRLQPFADRREERELGVCGTW